MAPAAPPPGPFACSSEAVLERRATLPAANLIVKVEAAGEGAFLEETQCGGRRSGSQGCAVPPICFANRLPRAPLRGACRVPDSRSAAHS
jgi:hypothetical protein